MRKRWAGGETDEFTPADIDGAGKQGVIVLAEFMTGIGPEGAKPFLETLVYAWNGSKFAHVKDVEKKLEDAKNADEVHARLAALKKRQ